MNDGNGKRERHGWKPRGKYLRGRTSERKDPNPRANYAMQFYELSLL